jgi:acetyl esterase/lipase
VVVVAASRKRRSRTRTALALLWAGVSVAALPAQGNPARTLIHVTSSIDGSSQPSYVLLPPSLPAGKGAPLVVLLHSWSYGLEQRELDLEEDAARRGWILVVPDFRGRNDHPEACGSTLAQQDVLDAVQWVRDHQAVDSTRIYVAGNSGGGYMTMLMVERAPQLWAAASAWVGISDLTVWYHSHPADDYGAMMRKCLGGAPGRSVAVAKEYRGRSPLARLGGVAAVPIDLAAGRHDTTVPIVHSLWAFNALARAGGGEVISAAEIAQLSGPGAALRHPTVADTATDQAFGRAIFLRRTVGASRITIFEGGHEWLPPVALAWLAEHHK